MYKAFDIKVNLSDLVFSLPGFAFGVISRGGLIFHAGKRTHAFVSRFFFFYLEFIKFILIFAFPCFGDLDVSCVKLRGNKQDLI